MGLAFEEPPQQPEEDPEWGRLLLLAEFRDVLRKCDEDGVLVTLWTDKYIANVAAGIQKEGPDDAEHTHLVGIVHAVPFASGAGGYTAFGRCNGQLFELQSVRSDRLEVPTDQKAVARDSLAHYAITHTTYSEPLSRAFASELLQVSTPDDEKVSQIEPSVAALMAEDPVLAKWQQYGEFLVMQNARGQLSE